MNKELQLISLKELSSRLKKSESAIRYHVRMGRIKPTAKFGRVYAFDLDDVLKQLQRGLK